MKRLPVPRPAAAEVGVRLAVNVVCAPILKLGGGRRCGHARDYQTGTGLARGTGSHPGRGESAGAPPGHWKAGNDFSFRIEIRRCAAT